MIAQMSAHRCDGQCVRRVERYARQRLPVLQARHQGLRDRDPRADIADPIGVGVVDDIAVQQIAIARGDAGGAGLEAKFAHHLRRRALDGAARR